MNDRQYILSLVSQGEHQQQDFKYKVEDAVKLARSVSAFANTDGGRLLIGVRDDGHLSGVRSDEEIYMMHQAALRYCRPEASIKFETFHVVETKRRTIVVCTVLPSDRKPVFALDGEGRQRAYIRIADENIVASPVHLAIWREESRLRGTLMHYGDDEQRLLEVLQPAAGSAFPEASYGQTLNQLVRRSRLPRHRVVALLARFIRFGLVEWRYEGQQFYFR